MAKKKVSSLPKQTDGKKDTVLQDQEIDLQPSAVAMDFSAENVKLQNLKFLNNVLVKETSDCRKKVETLVMEKVALEAELNRNGLEKEAMKVQLTDVSENIFGLELEKCVVCAFMETQIGELSSGLGELMRERIEIEELKREKEVENGVLSKKLDYLQGTLEHERAEIRKMVCERDAAKSDLIDVSEGTEELRKILNGLENTERMMMEEIEKLRSHCKNIEAKDEQHLNLIEEMRRELDLVERKLKESEEMIADLESKIKEIIKKKEEIELEKDGFRITIGELERDVKQLNSSLLNLTGEKKMLASKILESEKNLQEALEKENEMVMEITNLAEEMKEKKEKIQALTEKKDSLEQDLNVRREESKVQAHEIEILIREKMEIEEETLKGERKIADLQRELGKLKLGLITMEDKCRVEEEKSKQLITKFSHCSEALNRIRLEKENTENGLDAERIKAEKFRLELDGVEKRVEESERELNQMRREQEDQVKVQRVMETQVEVLEKDKELAEKKLSEAHIAIDDLKEKIQSAVINSERALGMVKKTVTLVCDRKDNEEEVGINGEEVEEEISTYVAELNAIKKAFKKKVELMAEMKIQLEEEEVKQKKRKSFFTMLTTATTILAAASAVYLTKGR